MMRMTPAALNMKKSEIKLTIEDGSTLNGYLVSLVGRPPGQRAGIRKVRLERKVVAEYAQTSLQCGNQLHKNQGVDIFEFVINRQIRPMGAKGLTKTWSLIFVRLAGM